MELTNLIEAKKCSPGSFDVQFFVYQRNRQLREGADSISNSTAKLSAVDRILIAQYKRLAFKQELKLRQAHIHLWDALLRPVLDYAELSRIGSREVRLLRSVNDHHERLLELDDTDAHSLREYAAFLLAFLDKEHKAARLLASADRIEESSSALAQMAVKNFNIMQAVSDVNEAADFAVKMTVSEEASRFGEITTASTSAGALLSQSPAELIGRSFFSLVPSSISKLFQQIVRAYTREGKQYFGGVSRLFLVHDTSCHLKPIRLAFREVPPRPGDTSVDFQCTFQATACDEDLIPLEADDHSSYSVLAASPRSFRVIGIGSGASIVREGPLPLALSHAELQHHIEEIIPPVSGSTNKSFEGVCSEPRNISVSVPSGSGLTRVLAMTARVLRVWQPVENNNRPALVFCLKQDNSSRSFAVPRSHLTKTASSMGFGEFSNTTIVTTEHGDSDTVSSGDDSDRVTSQILGADQPSPASSAVLHMQHLPSSKLRRGGAASASSRFLLGRQEVSRKHSAALGIASDNMSDVGASAASGASTNESKVSISRQVIVQSLLSDYKQTRPRVAANEAGPIICIGRCIHGGYWHHCQHVHCV